MRFEPLGGGTTRGPRAAPRLRMKMGGGGWRECSALWQRLQRLRTRLRKQVAGTSPEAPQPLLPFFSLFEAPASKVLCWRTRGNAIVGFVWVRSTRQARTCPAPAPKATELEADTARTAIFTPRYVVFVPFHRGFVFPRRYTEPPWPAHEPTQWLSPLTHPREGAPRALTTSCECRPPG